MEIYKIDGVSSYVEYIMNLELTKDTYGRPVEYLFRGQSDIKYELMPSLGRNAKKLGNVLFVERNMIEATQRRFPELLLNTMEPVERLGVLQHYGIPTRLLDLTENALVALFFACYGDFEKDGEVFVFNNVIDDIATYPIVNAIADSYRFARGSFCSLQSFYDEVIEQPYFLEQKNMCDICHDNSDDGAEWIIECCKKPIFVETSFWVERQRGQRGRYILFNNEINEEALSFGSRIKALPKNNEAIVGRVSVAAEKKEKILKELERLGVDRSSMFPDSMDIVCSEIKRKYFEEI